MEQEDDAVTAAEKIEAAGFEDVIIFDSPSYDGAFVGVTEDGRAVYDYDKMVAWLVASWGVFPDEAAEWIEYNTIGALPQFWTEDGYRGPVILHSL